MKCENCGKEIKTIYYGVQCPYCIEHNNCIYESMDDLCFGEYYICDCGYSDIYYRED